VISILYVRVDVGCTLTRAANVCVHTVHTYIHTLDRTYQLSPSHIPRRPHSCDRQPVEAMPIIYALVCRGTNVLAEHTDPSVTGNFNTVTRVLLQKIDPKMDVKVLTHSLCVCVCACVCMFVLYLCAMLHIFVLGALVMSLSLPVLLRGR
jgi:hypothetical protein